MYSLGIEAFLAVVRAKNISKAAEQLHLAQSTVSKRIRVLEEEVGAPLIERGKGIKTIHLTPAGEIFIELAERWVSLTREMHIMQSGAPTLSLSIGVLDSITNSIFPSIYEKLILHQEQLRIKVITTHSPDSYTLIEQRQVDVAFSLLEQTNPSVQVTQCYRDPFVVLRTTAFAQTPPRIFQTTDLDPNYELYVRWSPTYQLWHDTHWTPSSNLFFLDTFQLIIRSFIDDRFWSIVPLSVARNIMQQTNFSICYLSDPPPERIVYELTHKHPKPSAVKSLKIFDYYLQEVLSELNDTIFEFYEHGVP